MYRLLLPRWRDRNDIVLHRKLNECDFHRECNDSALSLRIKGSTLSEITTGTAYPRNDINKTYNVTVVLFETCGYFEDRSYSVKVEILIL